jgi:hypothetical protein
MGVGRRLGGSAHGRRLRGHRKRFKLPGEHRVRRPGHPPDARPEARGVACPVGIDDDFGSTPVLFQREGCPPQLVATRKHGALYLYDRDAITSGPRQTLNLSGTPYRFIGVAAFWPEENLVFVANPTPPQDENYTHGMVAFRVTAGCRLELAWQKTTGRNDSVVSPPVVANGVVYSGDGMGNQLHAFDARTGERLWSNAPDNLKGPVFAAPVVVDGTVLGRGMGRPSARLATVAPRSRAGRPSLRRGPNDVSCGFRRRR